MKTVSWFSAGVSSAVATKLAIAQIDQILYIHIEDHHPDTLRFVVDCQEWFGMEIERVCSPYKSVENAILGAGGTGYMNSPNGAPCTKFLKRRVRIEWEMNQTTPLRYVWGMDKNEHRRTASLRRAMPHQEHLFPLIERGIDKTEAHKILKASGLQRPAMYDLGYQNNNCIGCVKGGMGYWNRIRKDFPEVFRQRAILERRTGGSCINGVYLDELDPHRGYGKTPICEECGIYCEVRKL